MATDWQGGISAPWFDARTNKARPKTYPTREGVASAMNRPILFAALAGVVVIAALGTSLATGFGPGAAFSSIFEDPCDAHEPSATNATEAADPCGDGEQNDGAP